MVVGLGIFFHQPYHTKTNSLPVVFDGQIAFADRILLNKTDLVDEPAVEKVEMEIRRINKTAAIRRCRAWHWSLQKWWGAERKRCMINDGRIDDQ